MSTQQKAAHLSRTLDVLGDFADELVDSLRELHELLREQPPG